MSRRRRTRWANADHVVIVMAGIDPKEPRMHAVCQRCGERLVMPLPCNLEVWVAANRTFATVHATCRPREQQPTDQPTPT